MGIFGDIRTTLIANWGYACGKPAIRLCLQPSGTEANSLESYRHRRARPCGPAYVLCIMTVQEMHGGQSLDAIWPSSTAAVGHRACVCLFREQKMHANCGTPYYNGPDDSESNFHGLERVVWPRPGGIQWPTAELSVMVASRAHVCKSTVDG